MRYSPDELIVKVRGSSSIEVISSRLGAIENRPVFLSEAPELQRIHLLRFPSGTDVLNLAGRHRSDPDMEYIQVNHLYRPCAETIPNDPRFKDQWNMDRIGMPEAWSVERGSPEVVIAVIDTGVNYEHEDIKGKIWRNSDEIPGNGVDDDENGFVDDYIGWDFADAPTMPGRGDYIGWDNDPMDEGGHGSHVAGIAGAQPDNSVGIAGVAWRCRIMPVRAGFRVLVGGTYLQDDDAAAAIVYAADNGARVINMSWGDEDPSFVIRDAVDYAYRRGCVLVAAAGNDSRTDVLYPAAYRRVIAVAASDQNDRRAYFSNSNAAVDIAAPGMVILSLGVTDPYWVSSGTSMAAPHVSGVAALLISKRPDLMPEDVRKIIVASADKMDDSPRLVDAGRLNAFKALLTITPLVARITLPENNTGFDDSIAIIGTTGGYRFSSYQLLYGFGKTPERWLPITPNLGQSVESGQLGIWDVSRIREGIYTIRLEVRSADKMEINRDEAIVVIDHTSPEFKSIKLRRSIYGDRYETELLWQTDDQTIAEVVPRPIGSDTPLPPIKVNRLTKDHRLFLSRLLGDGVYELGVKAINLAGLKSETTIEAVTRSDPISPTIFGELPSYLRSLHPAEGFTDVDGDGAPEIWGMIDSGEGYGEVVAFEVGRDGKAGKIRNLNVRAFPWWVGDIDRDGKPEILLNESDLTFLLKGGTKIFEVSGVWGGIVADTDGDGRSELLLREERHNQIQIYEYTGDNIYLQTAALGNPSAGYNSIRYIAVGNMDGDGMTDIIFLDEDCDLILYENRGDDEYALRWVERIAEGTPSFLAVGDIRGNGREEVLLGILGEDEGKKLIYTLHLKLLDIWHGGSRLLEEREISNAISISNAARIVDLDGDGKKETIVTTYRDAYVLNDKLEPIWHLEEVGENRRIAAVDVNGDGKPEFGLNLKGGFRFFTREGDASLSLRPWGLRAIPLDERRIRLRWDGPAGWTKFNVYRAEDEGRFHRIVTVMGRSFTDSELDPDRLYRYAVTTVLDGWESEMSDPVELRPSPPPELSSIDPMPPSRIILEFNEGMDSSVRRVSSYELSEITTTGGVKSPTTPSSALLVSSKKVLLSFPGDPLKPGRSYTLSISGLSARTGAPMEKVTVKFEIPKSDEVFTDLNSLRVYPNPVSLERAAPRVIFDRLPPRTKVSIYTPDGNLIVELPPAGMDGAIKWNLLNRSSNLVASGIYIYIARFKGQRRTGKLAVVR
jgi:subtilisin family serine protease